MINDIIHRKSSKKYKNGDVYEGILVNNLKEGYGKIIYKTGKIKSYEREWK